VIILQQVDNCIYLQYTYFVKIPAPLAFDWDEANRDKNLKKHGLPQREIEETFFNRPIKIVPDLKHSQTERRFLALGKNSVGNYLTIIFTIRNNKIRVISARKQNKKERRVYEK